MISDMQSNLFSVQLKSIFNFEMHLITLSFLASPATLGQQLSWCGEVFLLWGYYAGSNWAISYPRKEVPH